MIYNGKQGKEVLEYIAISWIIISSGFVVLNYIYMIPCMVILVLIALWFCKKYRFIRRDNINRFIFLCLFIFIDEIVTLSIKSYPLVINNAIILIMRFFSLAIIQSHIGYKTFKKKYVNVICGIAVISLFCFILVSFTSINLPFSGDYGDPMYYGTFYFQIKQNSLNHNRNTGPYGEAGMFATALILAFAFHIMTEDNLFKKNNVRKTLILTVTILTTQSGTGMLCFGILMIVFIVKNGLTLKILRKPSVIFIIVTMVLGFCYVEMNYGIIESKVMEKGGSYGVRMDDTLEGYRIAKENFFFGTGIANDYSSAWNSIMEGSRSNGMANLAASCGIPFLLYYLFRLFKQVRLYAERDFLYTIALFAVLVCIYNTQPIILQTMGLSFLFNWKTKNGGA